MCENTSGIHLLKILTNQLKLNKMKKNLTTAIVMTLVMASACNVDERPAPVPDGGKAVVKASLSGYDGSAMALEGENTVNDLSACIFQDGRMTAIYENIHSSGSTYDITVDGFAGNMYVLANTDGLINLSSLKESNITEEDWLRLTVAMERGGPAHFFTGSVILDGKGTSQTDIPVSLTRGVARFDLKMKTAGESSVNSIRFRNVAQSAYLFPVSGEYSPSDVVRDVAEAIFDEPLVADTPAVMYMYEQEGEGIEVEVEAVIDGKPVTLSKSLSGDIVRNTVYTVTVRKDNIDVVLDITFEDWTQGGDTELTPVMRSL